MMKRRGISAAPVGGAASWLISTRGMAAVPAPVKNLTWAWMIEGE